MAGLVPANIRLDQGAPQSFDGGDVTVEVSDSAPETQSFNKRGDLIKVEHEDGSVTISLDGSSLPQVGDNSKNQGWFDNLAEHLPEDVLSQISNSLLTGIEDDIQSRADWIETRAQGIRLLGLKVELPSQGGSADGAPVEGQSRIRHPLLLEAVLRFQANAMGEMLPADGPMKIRNDDPNGTEVEDALADALEMDMNHYLTSDAPEYYPDTDRMLLMVGFGGLMYKKVYRCPLRSRPVSDSVDANDLIVNNSATSLSTARRATHRIFMKPSVMRRMQLIGAYRDVDLGDPVTPTQDEVQRETKAQQGIAEEPSTAQDRDYEVYECYCELDIPGFEHKYKGKPSGLEVPYRVTIDTSSKTILSIVRNYNEDTKDLPVARKTFVPYVFVPGLGYYPIGLVNILANTTNAVTAAWRELLDAGMFSNFPGFLMADTGARQNTNIMRVAPGSGFQVKTNGKNIKDAIMPLPYQPPSTALMQLVDNITQTGQRIGGTSELEVGEGRADVPVGTTMALIEQATKVLNSVHKRLHMAQGEEFKLLLDVFREHPEDFVNRRHLPSNWKWDVATFKRALDDYNLVPRADPNTASHTQRLMKVMALMQLAKETPTLFNPLAIATTAIKTIGFSDPAQFLAPPSAQGQPPPQLQEIMAKIQKTQKDADAKIQELQLKGREIAVKEQELQAKIQAGAFRKDATGALAASPPPNEADILTAKAKMMDAETRHRQVGLKAGFEHAEDENRDLDRQSHERIAILGLAKDILAHQTGLQSQHALKDKELRHQSAMQEGQHAHDAEIKEKSDEPSGQS